MQELLAVFADATSKIIVASIEAALQKQAPIDVFGSLFDWDAWNVFSEPDRAHTQEDLRQALQRFAVDSSTR